MPSKQGIATALPGIIGRKLRHLDHTLRFYVALDGLATSLILLTLLFWVDLAADRFFQPGREVRFFLLLLLLTATGYIFWWRLVRRVSAKIRPDQLAMVLERQLPQLNESLLTVVDLQTMSRDSENVHPELLAVTTDSATAALRGVNIHHLFKYRRLAMRSLAALVMLGGIGGFCMAWPETAATWFSRCVLLSNAEWPRASRIFIEGFDANGRARIARGDSFTMLVHADTSMPLVPETVVVRVGSAETGFRHLLINEFRIDDREGTSYRTFTQTFPELLESVEIAVHAGDTRRSGLRIDVVPPPVLTDLRLTPRYPAYMPPASGPPIRPTARTILPIGSGITLDAVAGKPLRRAMLLRDKEEQVLELSPSGERFQVILDDLREDTPFELVLEDHDGLKNRQPIRLEIAMQSDAVPLVSARLRGIGPAITPQATLPVEGQVSDDYGVASVRFIYSIDRAASQAPKDEKAEESAPTEVPGQDQAADFGERLLLDDANVTQYQIDDRFSAAPLNLKPGDRLTLLVEARDRFFLPGMTESGQNSTGDRWALDVVTPEQLKTMLDVREITLRQRFEVLIEEVRRTRGMIDELSFVPPKSEDQSPESAENELSEIERQRREKEREERLARQWQEAITAEQTATGLYNVTRSLRDIQKEIYDLNTIRQALDDIRLEMINNEIFTPETQQRVDEAVLIPLRRLIDTDFVALEERTSGMNRLLERPITQAATHREATDERGEVLTRFDQVLERMLAIRDGMMSMESYAEAIELLRTILRQQENLREETQEQKKTELRGLLD